MLWLLILSCSISVNFHFNIDFCYILKIFHGQEFTHQVKLNSTAKFTANPFSYDAIFSDFEIVKMRCYFGLHV